MTGRLIKYENRWIAQDCPGNGQPLTLPAGKRRALLSDVGFVPAGDFKYELLSMRATSSINDLLPTHQARAEGDVLSDRPTKQDRLLRHHADLSPKASEVHRIDIDSVNEHSTGLGLQQPRNQTHQRRLARAIGADDRYALAVLDRERHVLKGGSIRPGVDHRHGVKFDGLTMSRQLWHLHRALGFTLLGQDIRQALSRRRRRMHFVDQSREWSKRRARHRKRAQRENELFNRQAALDDELGRRHRQPSNDKHRERLRQRSGQRPRGAHAQFRGYDLLIDSMKPISHLSLAGVRLDRAQAVQRFRRHAQ